MEYLSQLISHFGLRIHRYSTPTVRQIQRITEMGQFNLAVLAVLGWFSSIR